MSVAEMIQGLDRAMILAAAAELREDAIRDKTYRLTPTGRLVGRYLDQLAFDNYSPKTLEERERILGHLALEYAHKQPGELVIDDLREYLARWKDAAPNYRRSLVSTLRVFFDWAEENDLIVANPARKLKTPRTKDNDSRKRALERETVRLLVTSQTSTRDRLAILLLYWCALRRAELRAVQVRDFDFAHRTLTVHGKGGTELEQNLPALIAEPLEVYLREIDAQPDWYFLSPQKQARYGTYPLYHTELVTTDPRKPYTLSGIDKWWERCRAKAGRPDVQKHELRHTAGTHFHQEGHDLVATQHFLRHKNPATTAKTYVHLDRVRAVADVQRRMADPLEESETE